MKIINKMALEYSEEQKGCNVDVPIGNEIKTDVRKDSWTPALMKNPRADKPTITMFARNQ